ncbi:hypothetical protein I3F58_18980 [Streptomyces sp. MUM 203J]|uniref:hypothetical protein n=1 Tax=Streptomyces sp. MUM 203J TaxID=2791990 RepID=UPI001F04BBB5|nr:hypothetical protein [Streptomyces sp. MUM 203J]MCH0541608.1 hypothetical protein [Streptomyces sp. MUM 203J]
MRRSRWTEGRGRPGHLALALLYYAVLTPAGACVRLLRDPLHRDWDAGCPTYLVFLPAPARPEAGGAAPGRPRRTRRES